MRRIARRLPYVGELRNVVINLERRLAALEGWSRPTSNDGAPSGPRQQTLAMVSAFWSAYDRPINKGEPPILIDLFHGIAEGLWRHLVVAKLVQRITGAPLVGLLGTPGSARAFAHNVSRAENMELASAFGVAHFVEVPESAPPDNMEQSVCAAIAELATQYPDGTPLPPTAISLMREIRTRTGFPIGQNVQQTFMDAEHQPTVLAGHRLLHWTKRVLGFHAFAEQLVSIMRPSTFVTGLIDCCPWHNLSEQLIRHGGRVICIRAEECRLPIYLLDHADESTGLAGMIRRIERESFAEFERRINGDAELGKRIDALAHAHSAAVHNGAGRFWTWLATDQLTSIPPMAFDSALPSYCLFTHPFTDSPPADESLFVDYLEWVEETCRHAAATRAYNLIVKVHPRDRLIDRTNTADHLAIKFADAPNIHFTRDPIKPEQLAKNCALGLTVRGTPGLEMTSLGLPMMLAGRGRYSDTGLCLVPATRSEYSELLEKGPPFPIDIAEQSRRARRFIAFDRHWSAPTSGLVSSYAARSGNDTGLWILIAEGFRSACLETDQAARALARAWQKRSVKVLAPELEELFNRE